MANEEQKKICFAGLFIINFTVFTLGLSVFSEASHLLGDDKEVKQM